MRELTYKLAFLASSVQPAEARLGVVSIRDDPDEGAPDDYSEDILRRRNEEQRRQEEERRREEKKQEEEEDDEEDEEEDQEDDAEEQQRHRPYDTSTHSRRARLAERAAAPAREAGAADHAKWTFVASSTGRIRTRRRDRTWLDVVGRVV